ncbi:hypothetical protein BHK98_00985 [Hornefia porci]|uniref:Uncharacterized protein n=1 Tax=Hornefia porci TaxID=2652292 RepID=A0A1Q9JF76_9FIRM|nr:hypothetical protein BHK98_00985 [Hornefia porci]
MSLKQNACSVGIPACSCLLESGLHFCRERESHSSEIKVDNHKNLWYYTKTYTAFLQTENKLKKGKIKSKKAVD